VGTNYEEDAGCKKTCAMLLVSGDNINSNEFTSLIEITPTEIAKAGDCSGWRLSSESHVESTSAERHIHWILDQIESKKGVINELKLRGCQVDVYCFWEGHAPQSIQGPLITPGTLRRLAEFEMNLIFGFKL
jgi:hypothetical protein